MEVGKETYEFARFISREMDELRSSHVFFIIQQAFDDDMEWGDVQTMLDKVIEQTEKDWEEG